jgi:hypothetical protein
MPKGFQEISTEGEMSEVRKKIVIPIVSIQTAFGGPILFVQKTEKKKKKEEEKEQHEEKEDEMKEREGDRIKKDDK